MNNNFEEMVKLFKQQGGRAKEEIATEIKEKTMDGEATPSAELRKREFSEPIRKIPQTQHSKKPQTSEEYSPTNDGDKSPTTASEKKVKARKNNKRSIQKITPDSFASFIRNSYAQGIFVCIMGFLLLNYLIGFVANFFSTFKTSLNPITNIGKALSIDGILGIELLIFGVLIVIILLSRIGKKKNAEDDRDVDFGKSDKYGTAGWMTDDERRQYLEFNKLHEKMSGIIFGRTLKSKELAGLPNESPLNRNFAVCGSQGTAKSFGYVRNAITQLTKLGESIILTDPKGEMYNDMAVYLKERGYIVKQWNMKDHMASDSWACLADVNANNISTFVDTVIRNTTDKFDAFYDNAEMDLLKALILYVKDNPDLEESQKTLGEAYNMLIKNDLNDLDKMFGYLEDDQPAKQAWRLFSKAEKAKGNAILGLGTRLQILQNPIIQQITGNADIDLELPAKKKCAYFIITSDQESTYDVLSTLFISYLFIKTVGYADAQPNLKTKVPIHFLLDEFPNLGEIPDFKKKLATVRGRGIGCSVIFQNIPQMQNRYPNNQWVELLGGCDIQILLGCNEDVTAEYYSKLTGEATIEVETERKNLSSIRLTDWTPQVAKSEGFGKRYVMNPDEIRRLRKDNHLLVWVGGSRPLKLKKYMFNESPEFTKITKEHPTAHIPTWLYELKEVTRFKQEYGGLYSLGKISDFPQHFIPVFEKWRQEAFEHIEKHDSTFNKKKKHISLIVLNKIKDMLIRLNIEQGDDLVEYIKTMREYGTVDLETYARLQQEKINRENKERERRQVHLSGGENSAGKNQTINENPAIPHSQKPANERSAEYNQPQSNLQMETAMNNLLDKHGIQIDEKPKTFRREENKKQETNFDELVRMIKEGNSANEQKTQKEQAAIKEDEEKRAKEVVEMMQNNNTNPQTTDSSIDNLFSPAGKENNSSANTVEKPSFTEIHPREALDINNNAGGEKKQSNREKYKPANDNTLNKNNSPSQVNSVNSASDDKPTQTIRGISLKVRKEGEATNREAIKPHKEPVKGRTGEGASLDELMESITGKNNSYLN